MGTGPKSCAYWALPAAMGSEELPVIIDNCWALFTDRKSFWRCFPRSQKAQSPPFCPCYLLALLSKQVQIIFSGLTVTTWLTFFQIQSILWLFPSLKEDILLSDHTLLGKFILTDLDGGIRLLHHYNNKYFSKSNLSLQKGVRTM